MSFLDVPGVKPAALDATVRDKINDPASEVRGALNATFVPKWKATTAYLAGDKVLSPGGDTVSAKVNFTSGASYSAANWDYSPTYALKPDNGGKPVGKGELMFNVKDYGATGNGTTDDTAAVQSALDAAAAIGGGIVFFPTGRYRHSSGSGMYLPPNVSVKGAGTGAVIISQEVWTSGKGVFISQGTFGTTVNLTADAVRQTDTLTLTSTTGMAVGDLLLVGSNEAATGSTTADGYRGEYARIRSVDSGTQLTLWGQLNNDYAVSASAGVMPTKTFNKSPSVSGLTIVNTQPNQHDADFIRFEQCLDATVSDVVFQGCDSAGVYLNNVYGATVLNAHMFDHPDRVDNVPKRFGYGVLTVAATENVRVSASSFTRMRHGFTTTGFATKWGQSRNIVVSGCTATECTSAPFDTHPGSASVLFAGCVATNTTMAAFQLRGVSNTVEACLADNTAYGVLVTPSAFGSTISGSTFRNMGGMYTGAGNDIAPAANGGGDGVLISGANGVAITGNTFENLSRRGVNVDGGTTGTASRVRITGNSFINLGKSGSNRYGVLFASNLTAVSDVIVSNNIFGAHATAGAEASSSGAIDDLFRFDCATGAITKVYLFRNLIYGLGFGLVAGTGSTSSGITERNNRIIDVAAELENVGNMFMKGYIKFDEAQNLVFGTTTGTKIGTSASQKLSFFNATPVVQRAAYTQTYSTATRTHAARTAAAVVTTASALSSYGFTQAQADAIVAAINNLVTDQANTAQIVNSLVNDMRNLGLSG